MKNNLFSRILITGALCTVLTVPTFVQGAEVRPISTGDKGIIPIGYRLNHWSETYLDQLSKKYDVESAFKGKDPDADITVEDFQELVKLTVDKEYHGMPDAVTREAVVHELTRIWAQKTGQDLESIPVIKMLVYSDTINIDGKYNHSITVAYMKDIAKGKGERLFDPKANVTYGEFAALLNNTDKAIENVSQPDGASVEEDTFETRGSYEIKDHRVVLSFELVNNHTQSKRLKFGSGQQFEIIITDEKGQEVYRYSDGKFFTMALIFKDVKPGQALKWQDEWDMTNKAGDKLTSGEYKARIEIMIVSEEGDQKIEADQLMTEMNFRLNALDREEAEKAAKQFIPEGSSFSVGDLDGDGTLEMVSITNMLPDKESILENFVLEETVVYKNARYGFGFSLPEGWEGYTIVTGEWEGLYLGDLADGSAAETGPVINIRHPQWTAENPRQDIPVMIFTLAQWDGLKRGEFHIGAAPVGPRELGRNGNYVLALPARYNYAFPAGYEEVERILESNPLKPID